MLSDFNQFINWVDGLVWGLPLIVLIMAIGIYLTIRLKVLQVVHLPKALKFMVLNEEGGKGEVSSFAALCTALSATIGTGNIVGVATAIVAGGPGALFWMWIAAFFGMATKYSEGLLAIKFRKVSENGHVLGGPFYYIELGMGSKFRWLAKLFAFFGACAGLMGIGTFTQVNGITSAVNNFASKSNPMMVSIFGAEYSIVTIITGLVITICAGLVLIGGLKRISNFAQIVVPFMAIIYIIFCVVLLTTNASAIPGAIVEVIEGAFGVRAVAGGALGAMMVAMQKGIARGIFSNESGLGSAPIAAAAAQTNEPARQGLVSMTGTFIDTIIICTMTGLSIVVTGAWNVGLEGVEVTDMAFRTGLPFSPTVASFLLMLCLIFFAFTTIIGWNYYSERCVEYLVNGKQKPVMVYRWLYILAVFIGPYMTVQAVWGVADIFNGMMAFPNLIALFALSGVIIAESKLYFNKIKSAK
ncbi:MAG: alanine:cation symporter family protein [Herbinix sp.]|jgi:AGCS family alanine or glycine:cation symporter|nr:alanine:cation symporter family protein [Herbinix sp.]